MENSIEQLISLIASSAKQAIDSGLIIPTMEPLFNWELQDFKYTEKGVENSSAHRKETIKKSWLLATRKLSSEICVSSEFSSVEQQIKNNYQSTNPAYDLERFCDAILPIYLDNPKKKNKGAVAKVIKRFIRDLKQEPVPIGAVFNVCGLILESKKVKIDKNTFIRQVEKKDLEVPMRALLGLSTTHSNMGTRYHSILNVELVVDRNHMNNSEIETIADKYIALLRLFNVGSVHYLSYQMVSDVLLPPFFWGTMTLGNTHTRKEFYAIKKTDEKLLRQFLTKLPIPKHVYNKFEQEKKFDHISIAFDRYSETLIESTFQERRITNIVIGLEALFSTDSVEIKFKLCTRISKVLFILINKDPLTVKKILSLAYEVRSKFSHGEHLNEKLKVKIEAKCQSIDEFSNILTSYLRISLVTMLVIGKDKQDFISLIDEALIEDIKNKELKILLKKVKSFLI